MKSTLNLAPTTTKMLGINTFLFNNTYVKCIGEEFRDTLNDSTQKGKMYRRLSLENMRTPYLTSIYLSLPPKPLIL